MTSETPVVGDGVRAAMARRDDMALGPEVYISERWSLTPGRDAAYLYSADSDTVYALPKA